MHCFRNIVMVPCLPDGIITFLLYLVPDRGPVNVTGLNISSTAVNISWGLIPKEYRNGIIIGYRLYYDDYFRHSGSITLPMSQRNVILDDLNSYTLYNISVAGLTKAGEGWSRTFVLIRTNTGGRDYVIYHVPFTIIYHGHLLSWTSSLLSSPCTITTIITIHHNHYHHHHNPPLSL